MDYTGEEAVYGANYTTAREGKISEPVYVYFPPDNPQPVVISENNNVVEISADFRHMPAGGTLYVRAFIETSWQDDNGVVHTDREVVFTQDIPIDPAYVYRGTGEDNEGTEYTYYNTDVKAVSYPGGEPFTKTISSSGINPRLRIIPKLNTGTIYNGTSAYCQVYYEAVTPYVLDDTAFKNNPNYYHGEYRGYRDHFKLGGAQDDHDDLYYPATVLHKNAASTTSKDEGLSAEYDASFSVSYRRFNGETVTRNYPVKVQKRMCEAYSKGKWKLDGNRYVLRQ
jgi:hypothetical protein